MFLDSTLCLNEINSVCIANTTIFSYAQLSQNIFRVPTIGLNRLFFKRLFCYAFTNTDIQFDAPVDCLILP